MAIILTYFNLLLQAGNIERILCKILSLSLPVVWYQHMRSVVFKTWMHLYAEMQNNHVQWPYFKAELTFMIRVPKVFIL